VNPTLKVMRIASWLPMPEYKTAGAAGLDLHSLHDLPIYPGERTAFGTGICVEIPPGFEGQVRPRSSLTAHGLVLPTGTIDSDYRGEIKVVLINTSREVRHIHAGDRIAQLVIAPVARCEVVEVEELSSTERGAGGFGSTGR
jgi:dUTP pyrophosphatase